MYLYSNAFCSCSVLIYDGRNRKSFQSSHFSFRYPSVFVSVRPSDDARTPWGLVNIHGRIQLDVEAAAGSSLNVNSCWWRVIDMIIMADLRDPWHPHEMFQTALFSAYCNKTLHYWFLFHTLLHMLQQAIIKLQFPLKYFPSHMKHYEVKFILVNQFVQAIHMVLKRFVKSYDFLHKWFWLY